MQEVARKIKNEIIRDVKTLCAASNPFDSVETSKRALVSALVCEYLGLFALSQISDFTPCCPLVSDFEFTRLGMCKQMVSAGYYAPTVGGGALSNAAIRPSFRPSVPPGPVKRLAGPRPSLRRQQNKDSRG